MAKTLVTENKRLLVSLTVEEFSNLLGEQIAKYSLKDEDSMNFKECCIYTGFSKSLLYKLTGNNEIPHRRRGKRLVFYREEIKQWLIKLDEKSVKKFDADKKKRKKAPYFKYIQEQKQIAEQKQREEQENNKQNEN